MTSTLGMRTSSFEISQWACLCIQTSSGLIDRTVLRDCSILAATRAALTRSSTGLFRSILERGVDRTILDLASACQADSSEVRADVSAFVAELFRPRL